MDLLLLAFDVFGQACDATESSIPARAHVGELRGCCGELGVVDPVPALPSGRGGVDEAARLSTHVRFTHRGWAEPVEFLAHCSTKWAMFLLSLEALIETGTGSPSPDDVPIRDWH